MDSFDSFEPSNENGPHAQTCQADAINEEDVSNSRLSELEEGRQLGNPPRRSTRIIKPKLKFEIDQKKKSYS